MKRFIYLLMGFLIWNSCLSQSVIPITPAISTTEIDSIVMTLGSKTVYSVTKPFSGVTAGMRVAGTRLPCCATVVSNTNDSILVLSDAATASVALDSLRFDKFTSLAYSAGDALGFPFEIKGGLSELKNVIVEDDAKQITAVKLIFFRDKFTQIEDNMPFAISDADAKNIIGYLSLATSEVFSNNQLVTAASTSLPIFLGGNKVYCQLICVGTPTFTAVNNLRINFIGN